MNPGTHIQQLNNIYHSLSALNIEELDMVKQEIFSIRSKKLPSVLTNSETELLKRINTSAPAVIQKRYNTLVKKRKNENTEEMLGLTSTGRVTIEELKLNRTELKNLRTLLSSVGKHPPQ